MPELQLKTTRDKMIAMTAAVVAGALFLGWNFVVRPQTRRLEEIRGERGADRSRRELVAQIAESEKRLAGLRDRLPEKADTSWLIESLNQLANDAGISLLSVTPVGREPFESYYRLPVRIEIECGYHQLGDFVSRIENNGRFIKVNTLHVEGARVPGQADVKLRVSMTLSALAPSEMP